MYKTKIMPVYTNFSKNNNDRLEHDKPTYFTISLIMFWQEIVVTM